MFVARNAVARNAGGTPYKTDMYRVRARARRKNKKHMSNDCAYQEEHARSACMSRNMKRACTDSAVGLCR